MRVLRFLNAGESHGPEVLAILEGFPAGLAVNIEAVNLQLERRQRAFGSGGRMRIERDRVQVTAGVQAGKTTGGPIALRVKNRDFENWRTRSIAPMTTPRPGHADLVGAQKYGYDDLRFSLERASARETTTRVAVGAFCHQLLGACGIEIGGYIRGIGQIDVALDALDDVTPEIASPILRARAKTALTNDLCTANDYDRVKAEVKAAVKAKDTLGGIFEVFALGLPPGLGSHVHWDRKLDGIIAQAMLSIKAMKGVEFGPAFANASRRGTQVHDEITLRGDDTRTLSRGSNRAGGLEGGMTTGAPLIVRVAMKPIATTLEPLASIDLATGLTNTTTYERSDFSALPRAVPIGEAMLAFVLADALLSRTGNDRLDDVMHQCERLRRTSVDDVRQRGEPFAFGYFLDDARPASTDVEENDS